VSKTKKDDKYKYSHYFRGKVVYPMAGANGGLPKSPHPYNLRATLA
jgi:hypothetical protein